MSPTVLRDIAFKSFLKLGVLVAGSFGFACGVVTLVGALVGFDVHASLYFARFEGLTAGILNLILLPLLFSISALVLGALAYIPFKFLLFLARGINLEMSTSTHTPPPTQEPADEQIEM